MLGKGAQALQGALRKAGRCAWTFVNSPALPHALAFFRIGIAGTLILQALSISSYLFMIYSPRGIVQAPIVDALVPEGLPRLSGLAPFFEPLGLDNDRIVLLLFFLYVFSLHLLLLGWKTRAASISSWLLQLTLKTSGSLSSYGVFEFATIALFYCVFMPVSASHSVDSATQSGGRSGWVGARLAIRVLQIHLCIVYFFSGLEKVSGEQWRTGEAFWRAVMRPGFEPIDLTWIAFYPWIPTLLCWATLIIELGYPFMIWPTPTRRIWGSLTIAMHAGIACLLGLWTFSAVMIVFNVASFLVIDQPDKVDCGKFLARCRDWGGATSSKFSLSGKPDGPPVGDLTARPEHLRQLDISGVDI